MKEVVFLLFLILVAGCKGTVSSYDKVLNRIGFLVQHGDLNAAHVLSDSLKGMTRDERTIWKIDSLRDISERIPLDFSLSEQEMNEKLFKRLHRPYNADTLSMWDKKGWLEYSVLNGEKRYFNRTDTNLVRIRNFNIRRQESDSALARSPYMIFRKEHDEEVIAQSLAGDRTSDPQLLEVIYTLTVYPDVVPEGETIRCWLPYPKENSPRQREVYLEGISNENFVLSPDTCVHRTIYLEGKAEKGKPVVFQISYRYISSGQYFDPEKIKALPYDRKSLLYRKYTEEQPPQICFTSNVRNLADSITKGLTDPTDIVRKIYLWFSRYIDWSGALEYSIIPNIPEYVLGHQRGDCGMQTFLFMSMLRYKGIPVKWQSGWMMPPHNKNLHDWCEVYYEGTGWVPVDISYGLNFSDNRKTREFYISGIDSYRLIINDGISGNLYPSKKFMRSEPFDFQRGEVEWKGGNLYFDKWDYEMKITYNNR